MACAVNKYVSLTEEVIKENIRSVQVPPTPSGRQPGPEVCGGDGKIKTLVLVSRSWRLTGNRPDVLAGLTRWIRLRVPRALRFCLSWRWTRRRRCYWRAVVFVSSPSSFQVLRFYSVFFLTNRQTNGRVRHQKRNNQKIQTSFFIQACLWLFIPFFLTLTC